MVEGLSFRSWGEVAALPAEAWRFFDPGMTESDVLYVVIFKRD